MGVVLLLLLMLLLLLLAVCRVSQKTISIVKIDYGNRGKDMNGNERVKAFCELLLYAWQYMQTTQRIQ